MRRFFYLCWIGVLSIGSLTGCNLFRGPDADNSRRNAVTPPCAAPAPPVQTIKAQVPAAVKQGGQAFVPLGTEAITFPAPVQTVAPAPVQTVAPALPPPPMPPRLPNASELPVAPLPPPPAWKSSANEGQVPLDKIVVVSNQQPNSAEGTLRALVDEKKPAAASVPRSVESIPHVTKEKTAPIETTPVRTGSDDKFSTITGQVQEFRKTFRLRYAAIDQEDIYGGVVLLEVNAELSQLRDGKRVRVRGVLIPPTERNQPARYRVMAVEPLD